MRSVLAAGLALVAASALALTDSGALQSLAFTDVRGRPLSIAGERGRVVALVTSSRYTRKTAERVGAALREHAARGQTTVVLVVDFVGIPRLFHGYAHRKILERTEGSPIRYIESRDGRVRTVIGAEPKERVDIFILDRDGQLRARFDGGTQLTHALMMIRRLESR